MNTVSDWYRNINSSKYIIVFKDEIYQSINLGELVSWYLDKDSGVIYKRGE
jgi:hypothetical protein